MNDYIPGRGTFIPSADEDESCFLTHIARKDHICDMCERKIPKGHRYWRRLKNCKIYKEHTNCENYRVEGKMGKLTNDGEYVYVSITHNSIEITIGGLYMGKWEIKTDYKNGEEREKRVNEFTDMVVDLYNLGIRHRKPKK